MTCLGGLVVLVGGGGVVGMMLVPVVRMVVVSPWQLTAMANANNRKQLNFNILLLIIPAAVMGDERLRVQTIYSVVLI